jgi:histidyl-tRNA synthetase
MATPLAEFKEVFKRTLGDGSDIVSKEMYEIADREEKTLCFAQKARQVARAILSEGLTQSMPLKFLYAAHCYERPQKGA